MTAPDVKTPEERAEIRGQCGPAPHCQSVALLLSALAALDAAQARIAELERIGPRAG